MKNFDQYRGCLIGGAVGDALGYPVEFLDIDTIKNKYGKNGITEYELNNSKALISDDTQMTLFTANGLLLGMTRGKTRGIMGSYPMYISKCYNNWYDTQTKEYPLNDDYKYSWLVNVKELFRCRAPGMTCLSAIGSEEIGTIEKPINNSKGCGGIMRVAPIGLYLAGCENVKYDQDDIDMIGAQVAALTHGHPLGYIPAAALVHIISFVAHRDGMSLDEIIEDTKISINGMFKGNRYLHIFNNLIDKAVKLSKEDIEDIDAIRQLGEGWVAEETLAIAIYCSLKYEDDFEKAITAAVNHSGDSDSTGAVTGNILGTYLGLSKIPKKFIDNLELIDIITELADDLCNDCQISQWESSKDGVWESKYIKMSYMK